MASKDLDHLVRKFDSFKEIGRFHCWKELFCYLGCFRFVLPLHFPLVLLVAEQGGLDVLPSEKRAGFALMLDAGATEISAKRLRPYSRSGTANPG